MRYYSYETYWPGDPGDRYDVEDWFESMADAQAAMMPSLLSLPAGSTGWVYRRYADGEIGTSSREFVRTDDGIRRKGKSER